MGRGIKSSGAQSGCPPHMRSGRLGIRPIPCHAPTVLLLCSCHASPTPSPSATPIVVVAAFVVVVVNLAYDDEGPVVGAGIAQGGAALRHRSKHLLLAPPHRCPSHHLWERGFLRNKRCEWCAERLWPAAAPRPKGDGIHVNVSCLKISRIPRICLLVSGFLGSRVEGIHGASHPGARIFRDDVSAVGKPPTFLAPRFQTLKSPFLHPSLRPLGFHAFPEAVRKDGCAVYAPVELGDQRPGQNAGQDAQDGRHRSAPPNPRL